MISPNLMDPGLVSSGDRRFVFFVTILLTSKEWYHLDFRIYLTRHHLAAKIKLASFYSIFKCCLSMFFLSPLVDLKYKLLLYWNPFHLVNMGLSFCTISWPRPTQHSGMVVWGGGWYWFFIFVSFFFSKSKAEFIGWSEIHVIFF